MREYKEIYNYEQYKKITSYKRRSRETSAGPGRMGPQTVLPLIHATTAAQL